MLIEEKDVSAHDWVNKKIFNQLAVNGLYLSINVLHIAENFLSAYFFQELLSPLHLHLKCNAQIFDISLYSSMFFDCSYDNRER